MNRKKKKKKKEIIIHLTIISIISITTIYFKINQFKLKFILIYTTKR